MEVESFFKELRRLKIHVNISFHQDTVINGPRSGLTRQDFEDLYKIYPKKMGKALGLLRCQTQIRSQNELKWARVAVENYKTYVKKNISEAKYIFQFDTFMNNRWRDWIKGGPKLDIELKSEDALYLEQMMGDDDDQTGV